MGRTPTGMNEKHWQAIRLFESGKFSRKEIAEKIGWGYDYLSDLCAGNVGKAGTCAIDFKKELENVEANRDKNIRKLVKENSETAQNLIRRILVELTEKKKLTEEEKKLVGTLTNCLAKSSPNVSIENLSYSYINGLTPEEMIHEFKRLKGIAESSFNRERILQVEQERPGELPEVDE